MAGGRLSDADRLHPVRTILGMLRTTVRMAGKVPLPGFVDRMGEEISDSSAHQSAAPEFIHQKTGGL